MPGLADLERHYVVPYYLKMMGYNALRPNTPLAAVRETGRKITDDQVIELLASEWRPRVMGAWFTSGRARRMEAALLRSLETSAGSLTAPPLAAVAVHDLGAKAVPSLTTYLRHDLEHHWGAAPFAAAALERLDAAPPDVVFGDLHRQAMEGMLKVARFLAGTEREDGS